MFNYKSTARENQDLFVLSVLDKKTNGTYLEVGSNRPIKGNNTYLLESEFSWTGISVEWKRHFVDEFNTARRNPCICADATTLDYTLLLEHYGLPSHIDYLQLDIDPPAVTLKALNGIDFSAYSFSVITYEHDLYAGGDKERIASRKLLEGYGYTRVLSDVMHGSYIFEDWYVNEKYMPNDFWKRFIGDRVPMNTKHLTQQYIDLFKML